MHKLTTLALVLFAAIVAPAAPLEAATKTVTAKIDFSKAEEIHDQVAALASALDGPEPLIYLDLTIMPGGTSEAPDYRVSRTLTKNGKSVAVRCNSAWQRFGSGTSSFSFAFNPDYNHLLLEVLHSGPSQAPFTTVACEYKGESADNPAITMRGYYAKSSLSVPTAVDIQLRPVTPSIAP
jgi:hypothetical protein